MFQQTLTRILLLSALGFLAACGGGGLSSTGGSASAGAGSGSGSGNETNFALGDLDGDWTGELLPYNSNRGDRNLYLRVLSGALIDSAEGGGGAWDSASSTLDVTFTTDGHLSLLLTSSAGVELSLAGAMNLARNTITGTFNLDDPMRSPFGGIFELRLSGGEGTFTQDLIAGEWNGEVLNSADRFRLSLLHIGVDGELIEAALTKPSSTSIVHYYRPDENGDIENTFLFFDSSIGRLEIVKLNGIDGSQLTFGFLLINDDGTLMSGPGEDTELGSGHVELRRPTE